MKKLSPTQVLYIVFDGSPDSNPNLKCVGNYKLKHLTSNRVKVSYLISKRLSKFPISSVDYIDYDDNINILESI
jgi:hypothetical protein